MTAPQLKREKKQYFKLSIILKKLRWERKFTMSHPLLDAIPHLSISGKILDSLYCLKCNANKHFFSSNRSPVLYCVSSVRWRDCLSLLTSLYLFLCLFLQFSFHNFNPDPKKNHLNFISQHSWRVFCTVALVLLECGCTHLINFFLIPLLAGVKFISNFPKFQTVVASLFNRTRSSISFQRFASLRQHLLYHSLGGY